VIGDEAIAAACRMYAEDPMVYRVRFSIGQGPLVRVLKVQRDGGQIFGLDPSTEGVVATFTSTDAQRIGESAYLMQRFGYSDTAQRTISLTFDDGADLKWTPELLDLFSAEKVPATFFATGTMIARNLEVFQREVREGRAVYMLAGIGIGYGLPEAR
jgi:biofilm PGA synthesis N-glycosyltransferase PgaC